MGRMATTFSHFGICVSDLDRSLRFYCDGLGFTQAEQHQIGPDFAVLMELDDVELTSQFIRKGDTTIELLAFVVPSPEGDPVRRAINHLGLTHLSFRVDDLPGDGRVAAGPRRSGRRVDPHDLRLRRDRPRLRLLHRSRRRPDRAHGPRRLTVTMERGSSDPGTMQQGLRPPV